ncbi:serine/threonine protein kinase [Aggregicoccus sp. 17bor-14]|uniref:serine/threonine-protein kinase n=1 Tax=Myxococcaceae TaxID=31 RepID=UPI00129C8050|nr:MULTISPECIES: serine/threonine-protein kinase [Myxococcaceae]MBF5046167.1 serine/threonine protein kinase [Simulacricoccus sp. 17bor-14]MRI91892.1 serine/threonine protein kinase [Aggregicoccus sp. 17bor-14]
MGCDRCRAEHAAASACVGSQEPVTGEGLEGTRLGALTLLRRLGAGAVGTVYLAEGGGSRFAVRVLHPHLAAHPALLARFYAEARAMQALQHPNLVRVLHAARTAAGHHCLVMEHVEGELLKDLRQVLSPGAAVDLLGQALEGLAAAHARGLVHRDLRPEQLLLQPRVGGWRVKLLDLGMAAVLAEAFTAEELAAGTAGGNPAYLAPEQAAQGRAVDARADLYALGVIGYQLVTGRAPFSPSQVRSRGRGLQAPPPHLLDARVPEALSQVLLRALAASPGDRFSSASEFRGALGAALRTGLAAGLRAAPGTGSAYAPLAEAPPPSQPAPAGLSARAALRVGFAPVDVQVQDVTPAGLYVKHAGALPPLASRLALQLRVHGQLLGTWAHVVRHVCAEEARAWGVAPGFFVHFDDPAGELALRLQQALAAAPPAPAAQATQPFDPELASLLARAAGGSTDPYALLELAPHAGFAEVQRRADSAVKRLSESLARPLPTQQVQALQAALERVEHARQALGDPTARAGLDAVRGNVAGVARCLAAGIPLDTLERLRHAFLQARPGVEARAAALWRAGEALEQQASRGGGLYDAALARYAEALALDPLNAQLQRHYWGLQRLTRGVAGSPERH